MGAGKGHHLAVTFQAEMLQAVIEDGEGGALGEGGPRGVDPPARDPDPEGCEIRGALREPDGFVTEEIGIRVFRRNAKGSRKAARRDAGVCPGL